MEAVRAANVPALGPPMRQVSRVVVVVVVIVVMDNWILFRWHYRTAAVGPPYSVNKNQFVAASTW